MSRFNAPPPNGDSRKMIEQRARDATRTPAPEKKGTWPFTVSQHPQSTHQEARTATGSGREEKPD